MNFLTHETRLFAISQKSTSFMIRFSRPQISTFAEEHKKHAWEDYQKQSVKVDLKSAKSTFFDRMVPKNNGILASTNFTVFRDA